MHRYGNFLLAAAVYWLERVIGCSIFRRYPTLVDMSP